jgi:6,7-dimethyl-8-ribityllumazine synthase
MTSVAFIHSLWHSEIVTEAHAGFVDEIAALGVPAASVEVFRVPGAFEIPLHAQKLARTGRYQAIVAAGLVVDGGIYRHEFVAETVIRGLMQVQLATEVPVFSVVLTPHHFHEHDVHQRFFHAHFRTKGAEAARAVHLTLESLARIGEAA